MKIIDERAENYVKLYDKIDRIQREFKTWRGHSSTTVSIKRRLLWFFHRTEFIVFIIRDVDTALVHVLCRGGQYNAGYLDKIGELLENEGFKVTAYLKEDC